MEIYKSLRAEALKRRFFDFKHKNETRWKEINASQLAIRNLNDNTGKHVNFIFTWFSLKPEIFLAHFVENRHFFLLFSL